MRDKLLCITELDGHAGSNSVTSSEDLLLVVTLIVFVLIQRIFMVVLSLDISLSIYVNLYKFCIPDIILWDLDGNSDSSLSQR